MLRAIFEVASEICHFQEDAASTMGHSGDVWDAILGMTQRKQRLDPPAQDAPYVWDYQVPHAALAQLLDGAVTQKDLHLRKQYIERIMGLSAETQRSLMSLIEQRKQKRKTPKKGGRTPITTPSHVKHSSPGEKMIQSPFTPYAAIIAKASSNAKPYPKPLFTSPEDNDEPSERSPRRSFDDAFGESATPARPSPKRASLFSPGLGDTAEIEKQFRALKEQNLELFKKLAKKEAKEEELVQKLEDSATTFRSQMMKVEAEARRREEDARQDYQEQLESLKEELLTVQQQYIKASKAQAELEGVKDEMELMAHTKKQLAETQERLQNYREKVQQLTDVREALKREEDAHSKSVEECLRLENELKNLHPLKIQLEEYKTRAVEAEVRLAEVQDELKKFKEQRWTSADIGTDMERTLQAQQEEIAELRGRLQQESLKSMADGAAGVGDGLSELNPELKEEVFRLRNENKQLQAFAAKRENDAVVKLEQDLDDATRLGDRYKTQYLSTREQLEQTQRNLQASRDRESKLRNEMAEAMDKIKLSQAMVEDVSQQLYGCHEELSESRNRESELESELAQWVQQAKQLQETSNKLASELRECSNELEASKNREFKLAEELTQRTQELKEEQSRLCAAQEELRDTVSSLKASENRETDLKSQLQQMISKSNELEEQIKVLKANLDALGQDLLESRSSEEQLTQQVAEATSFLHEANNKCEELLEQLGSTRDELASTRNQLALAQERELKLADELSDMKHRAEDAETMSKQRMDLLQATRDKLKAAKGEIDELKRIESRLSEEVSSWTKQSEVAEAKSLELQKSLSESIRRLNEMNEINDVNEKRLAELSNELGEVNNELEDWKQRAVEAEELTERLQDELVNVRDLINDMQLTLKSSKSNESNMEEDVKHAEQMMFCLEETIDAEIQLREQAEERLEEVMKQLSRIKQDFEETTERLTAQVDEQTERSNQYKQDLFHSQETLDEIQSSLGASQHREKMLRLEITKLHDRATELERELNVTKETMERRVTEASLSLETTCEVIHAKAQKDIEEIQENMNRLLEDERRAKRQADENYQRQVQQMRDDFAKEVEALQESTKTSLAELTRAHDDRTKRLRDDYETQLTQLKKNADEQNAQLVAKGKGMLKDVRAKAKEEHEALRAEFHELEQRLAKEHEEKEMIIAQAKNKVATYKKKLEFASSRINTLSSDSDELESRVKSLEREKFKLVEENDRYRRQLGGRGGPDSKLQSQLELLQKEFKSAMEEARELRRKLREKEDGLSGGLHSLDAIDENSDPIYSRGAVNQSTLVQLRTEYEETIEALNDEKRELVMKNSAAATDVQKAEKRAWESEQENSQLKQQLTSLQLQVERLEQTLMDMEHGLHPLSQSSSSESRRSVVWERPEPMEDDSLKSLKQGLTDLSSIAEEDVDESYTPSHTGESSQPVYQGTHDTTDGILTLNKGIANTYSPRALIVTKSGGDRVAAGKSTAGNAEITKARQDVPPFLQLHGATTTAAEAPPECKQC